MKTKPCESMDWGEPEQLQYPEPQQYQTATESISVAYGNVSITVSSCKESLKDLLGAVQWLEENIVHKKSKKNKVVSYI